MDLVYRSRSLAERLYPSIANNTYPVQRLVNVRKAVDLVLVVDSTANVALTARLVGHTSNSPGDLNSIANLGDPQAIAAGSTTASRLVIPVGLLGSGYWMPFLGVTIATGGTGATAGLVTVIAYYRNLIALPARSDEEDA